MTELTSLRERIAVPPFLVVKPILQSGGYLMFQAPSKRWGLTVGRPAHLCVRVMKLKEINSEFLNTSAV